MARRSRRCSPSHPTSPSPQVRHSQRRCWWCFPPASGPPGAATLRCSRRAAPWCAAVCAAGTTRARTSHSGAAPGLRPTTASNRGRMGSVTGASPGEPMPSALRPACNNSLQPSHPLVGRAPHAARRLAAGPASAEGIKTLPTNLVNKGFGEEGGAAAADDEQQRASGEHGEPSSCTPCIQFTRAVVASPACCSRNGVLRALRVLPQARPPRPSRPRTPGWSPRSSSRRRAAAARGSAPVAAARAARPVVAVRARCPPSHRSRARFATPATRASTRCAARGACHATHAALFRAQHGSVLGMLTAVLVADAVPAERRRRRPRGVPLARRRARSAHASPTPATRRRQQRQQRQRLSRRWSRFCWRPASASR